ncbi:MAG: hypothetical protein PHV06_07695, partial [bacterium]|nr:hypothetical protein [bacterium]
LTCENRGNTSAGDYTEFELTFKYNNSGYPEEYKHIFKQKKNLLFYDTYISEPGKDAPDENDIFNESSDVISGGMISLSSEFIEFDGSTKSGNTSGLISLIFNELPESVYGVYKEDVIVKEDANVGIFIPGFFNQQAKLLGLFSESISWIDIFDRNTIFYHDKELRDYNMIILPSASLMGIENDIELKYDLEKFVENGGVLVCFSQQHGYEFSALPGGEVSGMGWREDQACHTYSVYLEEYHPVLSSLTNSLVNCNVDGYFTSYPENSKILLRRVKNGYPAMIMYPYGNGYVIASTLYTDWSYDNFTLSREEKNIYRDVISWAKKELVRVKNTNIKAEGYNLCLYF